MFSDIAAMDQKFAAIRLSLCWGRVTTPFPTPLQVVEGTHAQAHVSVTSGGFGDVQGMLAGFGSQLGRLNAGNPNPDWCVDSQFESY